MINFPHGESEQSKLRFSLVLMLLPPTEEQKIFLSEQLQCSAVQCSAVYLFVFIQVSEFRCQEARDQEDANLYKIYVEAAR